MGNFFRELLSKSDSSGSKSTVLKPLTWFISILIAGIIFSVKYNAPKWILIFFVIVSSVVILLFLFSYIYCLFVDRDALRSEKFSIQKMAIERGLYGDNTSGVLTGKEISEGSKSSESEEL